MSDLTALAERVERLTEPCWDTDMAIVEMAYALQWPLACYENSAVNYDPALWMERHDWRPTASLDAAMSRLNTARDAGLTARSE